MSRKFCQQFIKIVLLTLWRFSHFNRSSVILWSLLSGCHSNFLFNECKTFTFHKLFKWILKYNTYILRMQKHFEYDRWNQVRISIDIHTCVCKQISKFQIPQNQKEHFFGNSKLTQTRMVRIAFFHIETLFSILFFAFENFYFLHLFIQYEDKQIKKVKKMQMLVVNVAALACFFFFKFIKANKPTKTNCMCTCMWRQMDRTRTHDALCLHFNDFNSCFFRISLLLLRIQLT